MPTVAAGTFSMNCAYFGIPCIGNENVDTQAHLFPDLCVEVNDIHMARHLAIQLRSDKSFYEQVSTHAQTALRASFHLDNKRWLEYMKGVLDE